MKLRFILLLCCCFSALFFIRSISLGAMSQSCKEDIVSKLDKLNDNDLFNDNTYDYLVDKVTASNFASNSYYGDNYFIMIGKGSRYRGGGHNWNKLSTTLSIYICPFRESYGTITDYTNSESNTLYTTWNCSNDAICTACFSTSNRYAGSFAYGDAVDGFYIYTTVPINTRLLQLGANEEYGGFYVNNDLRFTPYNNNIQTIGGISNIHVENFSRSVYEWRLGTLTNFDSYTTGVLEMYQGENSQWVPINGVMAWNSNGEVYLYNRNIYYYQLYRVSFYDRDYNYTDSYGYYFLPIGVTYSGDSLIYNGNDNNTNTPIINAITDSYSFNSGDVSSSFNKYLQSGDAILGLISSSSIPSGDNLYYNFLYETFISITDTLKSSGNVTLNIDYRDFHMVLNSSDFYIPDSNPLKQFVKIALITGVIFLIYQQIDKMIRHLNNLQIAKSLHDTDVDYDIFL